VRECNNEARRKTFCHDSTAQGETAVDLREGRRKGARRAPGAGKARDSKGFTLTRVGKKEAPGQGNWGRWDDHPWSQGG